MLFDMIVFLVVTAAHRRRTEQNFIQGGEVGGLCNMVQPLTLLYAILNRKVTPFVYLLLINGTLYLFYLFILPCKMYKEKKEKIKIHYRTKLARKPLIETTGLIT